LERFTVALAIGLTPPGVMATTTLPPVTFTVPPVSCAPL
jgi:hypothetical protein